MKKKGKIIVPTIVLAELMMSQKMVLKTGFATAQHWEFVGLWEKINNSQFKGGEFDSFMMHAG